MRYLFFVMLRLLLLFSPPKASFPNMLLIPGQIIFNGSNYVNWSRSIQLALGAKNKTRFIDGSLPRPPETSPDLQKWIRNDYMRRTGKYCAALQETGGNYSMERILERYERYSYAERQLIETDIETQGSWSLEHAKLKARIEVLQKNQRNYKGEDLDSLSLKELHNLENQLDSALKHIRSRKSQLMFESISVLQKKDKSLQEHNNLLGKKVKNKEKETAESPPMEQQNHEDSSTALTHQLHSVNVSDVNHVGDGEVEEMPQQHQASTSMPAWMLTGPID